MAMAKKSTKSAVWVDLERVVASDILDLCPDLDSDTVVNVTTTGAIRRKARLNLETFTQFERWSDTAYGLCSVDDRGY